MKRKTKRDLMMITFDKASELYLSTLATEGKSPRYIDWLKTRLRYFDDFLKRTYGDGFKLQDLTIKDGRTYIRELMERDTRCEDHPMHKEQKGKIKIQYIHGLGRAVQSFSTWAYEEGYLDENVMRRLKLPQLPKTLPEPLGEEEIQEVLTVCLDRTYERLRNFSIMMLFFDTGIRLDELVNLKLSRIDFTIGEMTIIGKGNKERKVPIGLQAQKMIFYPMYLTNGIFPLVNINQHQSTPILPQGHRCSHLPLDGKSGRQIPLLWLDEALAVRASPAANAGRASQKEGFRCACGA